MQLYGILRRNGWRTPSRRLGDSPTGLAVSPLPDQLPQAPDPTPRHVAPRGALRSIWRSAVPAGCQRKPRIWPALPP
jgi:hypothetical protein